MSATVHEGSNDLDGGASARVADVLKSSLERHLFDEDNSFLLAGHGSHVVSDKFVPDDEGNVDMSWDDERFREFTERLSKLQDPAGAL